MKPRERVMAQLRHRETDFVPYGRLDFDGDVAERLDLHYGDTLWRKKVNNHIRQVPGPGTGIEPGVLVAYDPFGSKWRTNLRPMHLEEPALKEPTFCGYTFPGKERFFEEGWKETALQEIAKLKNYFVVAGFGFGLFERTWAIRGFENVLMDSIAEPKFYQELVERVTALQIEVVEELLTLPVDGIMFSDDWGDQRDVLLGPERWRTYLKPHLAKMYDVVHRSGKYCLSHCCGNVQQIIPDLIEIGLDVLQSVQPEAMNPYELKKQFGKDITFWGGLGSQHLIPFGSPEEIRAEVTELCRVMGKAGGYILGPAKALQPETPTENAAAVVEAFLEKAGESL